MGVDVHRHRDLRVPKNLHSPRRRGGAPRSGLRAPPAAYAQPATMWAGPAARSYRAKLLSMRDQVDNEPKLVSVGYEGRDAKTLISLLEANDVQVLVDVRLNPISRKPGLSKGALSAALEAAGIRYVHYRSLGNPKDNRAGFRAGDQSALTRFSEVLSQETAGQAIRHVTELLEEGVVALLCFERDHAQCHRRLVAEAIRDGVPESAIVCL